MLALLHYVQELPALGSEILHKIIDSIRTNRKLSNWVVYQGSETCMAEYALGKDECRTLLDDLSSWLYARSQKWATDNRTTIWPNWIDDSFEVIDIDI